MASAYKLPPAPQPHTTSTATADIMITQTSLTGKRPHCALDTHHPVQWPLCKRPRYISTPTSAISVVTAEEEDDQHLISPHSSSIINYHLPSPTYTIPFSTPSTQSQLQLQHSPPDSAYFSPSPSTTSPSTTSPEPYALRSDEDIVADVDNSFATGHTGALAWNNEVLIQVLTNDIEDLCFINHRNPAAPVTDEYHSFFSQYKQPFELEFYIRRLVHYSNCSTAAFVIMLVYLDRIQENCAHLLVTDMNCHRLLCTALVLAIKFLDDEVFSNTYYARVGGVTPEEMNQLELKLLNILGWNLCVSPETFSLYEDGLIESANSLSQNILPSSPTSPA